MAGTKRMRKAPEAERQLDLFITPLTDIRFRDEQETMELPFLSLSKSKRTQPIKFTTPRGMYVIVSAPEQYGIATIWDFDLVIWGLSQIIEKRDRGEQTSPRIRFSPYEFFRAVRRNWDEVGKDEYTRLQASIERLTATVIETNLRAEHKKEKKVLFHWIEYAETKRSAGSDRIEDVVIQFPQWLYDGVMENRLILSINPDYFLLTGGYERWLYRFMRKCVGKQNYFIPFTMKTLHERSGSTLPLSKFAFQMRELVKDIDAGKAPFPDYILQIEKRGNAEYMLVKHIETKQPIAHIRDGETKARYKAGALALSDEVRDKARAMVHGLDLDEEMIYLRWKARNVKNTRPQYDPGKSYLGYVSKSIQNLKTRKR